MGAMAVPWVTAKDHGRPWQCHGLPWVTIGQVHGLPRVTVGDHGSARVTMAVPWVAMGDHGIAIDGHVIAMGCHGRPLATMAVPRAIMAVPWVTTDDHGKSWHIHREGATGNPWRVPGNMSLIPMACHGIPWEAMAISHDHCHGLP